MTPRALGLLLVLMLVGCASGGASDGPEDRSMAPQAVGGTPGAAAAPLPELSKAPWTAPTITTGDLKAKLDAKTPLLLADVRSKAAYEAEHITGAVSVPWADVDKRQAALPRGKPIVLYCA